MTAFPRGFRAAVLAAAIFQSPAAPAADDDPLYRSFAAPSADYRGKPFWSWNGKLDKTELIRQIHVLKKMGFGGFFMHSRTGLATEYLGREWFDLISACADEAEKLGMEAWLYDEDRWPSGSAGGIVTRDPKYRTRYLRLSVVPAGAFTWSPGTLAAFVADVDGINFRNARRLARGESADGDAGRSVLKFTVELMKPGSFYNGAAYLDTLNPEATARFIEVTHERYARQCGDRLGRSIKGIFTDEPHRGMLMSTFGSAGENPEWLVPWTDRLPQAFRASFGYDILDHLPEVFLRKEGQAVSPVKWQYVENLQRMFLGNFLRPIDQWCQQHKVVLTGHVLHEDSLSCQVVPNGSMLRNYEYMGNPGIDLLTEGNRSYWVAKQLDSVAHQQGRKWRLSEMYGVTGWQFSFEGHKNVGDWQALFGINVRCHHLSWYTMKGEAKRDYPASILHQSAWWPYYDYVESYFSRLGVLTTAGEPVTDVLVVNPVESLWAQIRPGWCNGLSSADPELQRLETAYQQLFQWLARRQIDFDYGDEDHIARYAKVVKESGGPPLFEIGRARYQLVVVPQMTTIRSTTLDALERFLKAGGRVIVTQSPPAYVDAKPSRRAATLGDGAEHVPFNSDAVVRAVTSAIPPMVQVLDGAGRAAGEIYARVRRAGDDLVVVALNTNRRQPVKAATIRVRGEGNAEQWDCATGSRFTVAAEAKSAGCLDIKTDFPPGGERTYVITRRPAAAPPKPDLREVGQVALAGPFEYELSEPNVCVLDRAGFRVDDGAWQAEREILKADQAIRTQLHLDQRGGEMLQPWFVAQQKPTPKATVALRYGFEIAAVGDRPVDLALETPELFQVDVNGRRLDTSRTNGWWVDPCFVRVPLPADMLKSGKNVIELSCRFHEGVDLESIYLLGDFGVRLDGPRRILTRLPKRLEVGTIATQGLPFYGAAVTYFLAPSRKPDGDQKSRLRLAGFEGACVMAGGERAENVIAWQPYEADVTAAVAAGERIPLRVVLTRRNTFGPLHLVPMRSEAYGPGHWITGGAAWTDNYQLWPAGLLKAPQIVSLQP